MSAHSDLSRSGLPNTSTAKWTLPTAMSAQAKACASQCLQAAQAQGISELEIKESIEDLTAFMAAAIEEAGERGPGDDLADEDD